MASLVFTLPWPPSANAAWRAVDGGVRRSEDYRGYRKRVGEAVLLQKVRRHWTHDRLAIGIYLRQPNRRAIDIDNRVKTVLDSLQHTGVIPDDQVVDMLIVARGRQLQPEGAILVRIEELESMPMRLDMSIDWFADALPVSWDAVSA